MTSAALTTAEAATEIVAGPAVEHFALANGMEVVVIPDHRAPVVTHMVWYRNGSADDPARKSGIAHFLEHLMFKGTAKHPDGAFSRIVADLGGQENAFTSYDYTAYFQRVAREHLGAMMEIEADRMTGLVLSDDKVDPERDVVLEERKMRTDSDPSQQLAETMAATLFVHHPYGLPIIGWKHEIEGLVREDALSYYRRFYTPENAILVVAGDVGSDEVKRLAEQHYGVVPAAGEPPRRTRPQEPEPRAARRVSLADDKVEQPSFQRLYTVPPFGAAPDEEVAALEVLAHILGGGQTSRLYTELVLSREVAVNAGAWYMSSAVDLSRFALYAVPREDVSLETLEAETDAVLNDMLTGDIEESELARAKTRLIADLVYAQDSQASMARIYGASLAVGQDLDLLRRWPALIEGVTPDAIRAAGRTWLALRRSVTGWLLKDAEKQKSAKNLTDREMAA